MAPNAQQHQAQEAARSILRIEHAVRDFDEWKRVFDEKGPLLRQKFGALRYQVFQSATDPNYVMVDTDFGSLDQAEGFLDQLRGMWQLRESEGVIVGPQGRIVVAIEGQG